MTITCDENAINFDKVPNLFSPSNPMSLNHSIKYAAELNLLLNNPDEMDEEYVPTTDGQISSIIENNYSTNDEQMSSNEQLLLQSDQNATACSSKSDTVSNNTSLTKSSIDFISFPSFPSDQNVTEVNFDDIFN